ncbi:hypothetical protein [Streptomyces sp. PSKA30]|uniref:hypothetical protein n=1 Tax=Streptomyces sp. PSKA30 TaxID=2874597 RepID=UPI001CD0DBE5|nr:hypothetical protein [Streptomyces sp. PSKA30]MBZ9643989.1 hypothetical protein [Streptomyces sp. PSKA30]
MGAVPAQPIPRVDPEIVGAGADDLARELAPALRLALVDPAGPQGAGIGVRPGAAPPTTAQHPFLDPVLSSAEAYTSPEWAQTGPASASSPSATAGPAASAPISPAVAPSSLLSTYTSPGSARAAPPDAKGSGVPLFQGSLRYVDLRLPGDPLPFRIVLDPATVTELVEVRYRFGGWQPVDELIDAARLLSRQLLNAAPASETLQQRAREALHLEELLRAAAADLAKRVVRPLVQAELLARREVLRRLDVSTSLLAYDFARLAPNSRYARYLDGENREGLMPALLLAELADHPWEPEELAPEFGQLAVLIDELGRARNWAASVRLKGVASFTASVTASVQGLLAVLEQEPGPVGRAVRAGVARIQELADALSGKARTTAPIPPHRAFGAIGSEFTLAVDEAQRAAQLVLITETALGAVFPIARRLDTAALAGAGPEKLRLACAAAGAKVASDAAAVEAGLGLRATSLGHLTADRADIATGEDSAGRDAFTYPVAVYASLEGAGLASGSLSWAAADEAMRARGVPAPYLRVWQGANLAGGLAGLLTKKAGPAAAMSSAAYSLWEAGQQTMTFWQGARTWNAVLEPALRLIEKDPELSDLAMAYGTAFVDVVFAAVEIAPLLATAAL